MVGRRWQDGGVLQGVVSVRRQPLPENESAIGVRVDTWDLE